jgi:hypothetical protein
MQRSAKTWADTSQAEAALQAARTLRNILRNAVERVAGNGRIPSDPATALTKELQRPRLATDVVHSQRRFSTARLLVSGASTC